MKQPETRMAFRVLSGVIAALLLLVGLPIALYGVFTGSGTSLIWNIVWAIASLYGGVGMAGGALTGRWYDERA